MRAALFASLVLASIEASSAHAGISGRATVINGDTLEIHGTRIRLYGVDAPESSQRSCTNSSAKTEAAMACSFLQNYLYRTQGRQPVRYTQYNQCFLVRLC